MSSVPNEGETEPTSLVVTIGNMLAPIVGILILLELVMAASQIWHFAHAPAYPAHVF